ncbi:hypothetical protein [Pseudomonas sp. NPDC089569]|uniref:hypothetical protein n=1 Tax=Pseudomonas sp. NPDC089569 TaxID=3390722 RepID=UPI003D05FA36
MNLNVGDIEMNVRKMSFGLALSLGLGTSCFASAPVERGVVHFQGAIVQGPCRVSDTGQGFAVHDCPRGHHISAQRMAPVATVDSLDPSGPEVKLLVESNAGQGNFTRQYVLLNAANEPVSSGTHRITLTYP